MGDCEGCRNFMGDCDGFVGKSGGSDGLGGDHGLGSTGVSELIFGAF